MLNLIILSGFPFTMHKGQHIINNRDNFCTVLYNFISSVAGLLYSSVFSTGKYNMAANVEIQDSAAGIEGKQQKKVGISKSKLSPPSTGISRYFKSIFCFSMWC